MTSVNKSLSSKTAEDFKIDFLNSIGGRRNRRGALAPNHLPPTFKDTRININSSKKLQSPDRA